MPGEGSIFFAGVRNFIFRKANLIRIHLVSQFELACVTVCNDPSWILRHVFVQHKRVQKYQKETPTATTAKTRFQHPHEQPQNFENHQTQTFFKPHPTPTTGRSGDRGCLGRRVQRPRSTSFTFGQRPLPYDLQFQQFFTLELGFLVFFCRCHRHRHRHHRDPNVF